MNRKDYRQLRALVLVGATLCHHGAALGGLSVTPSAKKLEKKLNK